MNEIVSRLHTQPTEGAAKRLGYGLNPAVRIKHMHQVEDLSG